VLIECWTPVPRLVVVGAAAVADALAAQAALLGWEPSIVANVDAAMAATQALTASDIVVVLEHRPSIATPVLAAALRGAVGYVGALGSRRTQEVRRTALLDAGVTEAELAQLHGPTGLDIGARSAGETAVSIAAEIIAVRSGRDPRPLRDTATRIST
jgi:xanthine dehydrogenase accessory factor